VSPYQYNSSNQLTSIPGTTYTYDNNGNTKTKTTAAGTTTYTWDFENRLTQVALPGTTGTVTFKYDPFGRRVQKAFTQGGTTTTTNYLYDGANVIEEMDNGGNVLARYTQGPVADEQLSELRSGTTSYYDADGLGSITSLSNGAGTLANTYTYEAYGKLIASSGTLSNPFQYTGREFDSETAIYEYRARYFDPNVGRFISQDPIGFKGGINFYAYVGNNPINLFDPTGLAAQCKHCKLVVKCRGVQKYHLGLLGFQHCDAQVVDDNGVTHSLSGGPDPATNGELLNFWNTTTNLPPFGGTTIYNNQNASCDTANGLVNGANSFHNDPMHFAYIPYGGPNSNTALGGIFGRCGIHLNIDWTGPTGPGFSTMTPQ
jgi:RHS repeat-associated protein